MKDAADEGPELRRDPLSCDWAIISLGGTAPKAWLAEPALHWYVQVSPWIGRSAGFALGSGVRINTVAPEGAASSLAAPSGERRRGAAVMFAAIQPILPIGAMRPQRPAPRRRRWEGA